MENEAIAAPIITSQVVALGKISFQMVDKVRMRIVDGTRLYSSNHDGV